MPHFKHRLLLELLPQLLAGLGQDDSHVSAISLACICISQPLPRQPASCPYRATQSAPSTCFGTSTSPPPRPSPLLPACHGTLVHHRPEDAAVADDSQVRLFTHRRVHLPSHSWVLHPPSPRRVRVLLSQTQSRSGRTSTWILNRRTRARIIISRECGGQQRDGVDGGGGERMR
ncbi:hypothetical protein B0H16DRAFT_1640228 [Mycena metata]|uniref:Uncharacterized protein n=1 Tax=Mycena metata TaxID=1033252 RepID=A0AAD7DXE3_9AGAR|nr:hypothetical protein B0H16DRAFT_1640228 [Mycena metata]